MRLQPIAAQHDRIRRQLNEERAFALLRISRALESLISQLEAAGMRVALARPEHRAREMAAYREIREQALRYRWYLEVQREALGLRHQHGLDEFYRIPPPIET